MEHRVPVADSKKDRLAALERNQVACCAAMRAIVPPSTYLHDALVHVSEAFLLAMMGVERLHGDGEEDQ